MALKFDFDIHAIALEGQSIEDKHKRFLDRLDGLDFPWAVENKCNAPDPGRDVVAMINWAKIFGITVPVY